MSFTDVILTVFWKESSNCSSCMERQRTRLEVGDEVGRLGGGERGFGGGYASGWKCAVMNHVQPSASWPVHKAP